MRVEKINVTLKLINISVVSLFYKYVSFSILEVATHILWRLNDAIFECELQRLIRNCVLVQIQLLTALT